MLSCQKPTASDLGSFENQIKMSQDRSIAKMGKVNFDAASRMKAAVNSEFIEPKVTNLARRQIEKNFRRMLPTYKSFLYD